MSTEFTNFTKLRHGIFEHVERGTLSPTAAWIFLWMCSRAHQFVGPHIAAGVWVGSARAIHRSHEKSAVSRTEVQRAVKHLIEIGWVKPFTLNSSETAFVLHKMTVLKGRVQLRVDAHATTDWQNPVFQSPGDEGSVAQNGGVVARNEGVVARNEGVVAQNEGVVAQYEPPKAPKPLIISGLEAPKMLREIDTTDTESDAASAYPQQQRLRGQDSGIGPRPAETATQPDARNTAQHKPVPSHPSRSIAATTPPPIARAPRPRTISFGGPPIANVVRAGKPQPVLVAKPKPEPAGPFDPLAHVFYNTEPIGDLSAWEARRILFWAFLGDNNKYWRDSGNIDSVTRLTQALPTIAKQAPGDYRIPGWITDPISIADPACTLCEGNGSTDAPEDNPIYPPGLFLKSVPCSCLRMPTKPWTVSA